MRKHNELISGFYALVKYNLQCLLHHLIQVLIKQNGICMNGTDRTAMLCSSNIKI
jgi:hypothetical protein